MRFFRKTYFPDRLCFDLRSFNEITRTLRAAGFGDISIRIPEKGYDQLGKKTYSPEEYVELGYNFVAQILTAKSQTETIKVLFVNHGKIITSFDDKIFPSGHSVRPSHYVETSDPVRLLGLQDFVSRLLEKNSSRTKVKSWMQNAIFSFGTFYLLLSITVLFLSFTAEEQALFSTKTLAEHPILLLVIPAAFVMYMLYHVTHPGGMYVAPFEHPIVSFYRRISAGDLRNNLLIVLAIGLCKVVLGGIVIGVVINILSDALTVPVTNYLKSIFAD